MNIIEAVMMAKDYARKIEAEDQAEFAKHTAARHLRSSESYEREAKNHEPDTSSYQNHKENYFDHIIAHHEWQSKYYRLRGHEKEANECIAKAIDAHAEKARFFAELKYNKMR